MIYIDVQAATRFKALPSFSRLKQWIENAAQIIKVDQKNSELTIRFIDKEESTELNRQYRHKEGPTNILSFPDESIPGFSSKSFGDLVICAPLVAEEAQVQDKITENHFAHLVIHGFLHLLGYNHVTEKESEKMEDLEIRILSQLGYEHPYE